jgi:hypothetical protein
VRDPCLVNRAISPRFKIRPCLCLFRTCDQARSQGRRRADIVGTHNARVASTSAPAKHRPEIPASSPTRNSRAGPLCTSASNLGEALEKLGHPYPSAFWVAERFFLVALEVNPLGRDKDYARPRAISGRYGLSKCLRYRNVQQHRHPEQVQRRSGYSIASIIATRCASTIGFTMPYLPVIVAFV